jgi:hypothetical protein
MFDFLHHLAYQNTLLETATSMCPILCTDCWIYCGILIIIIVIEIHITAYPNLFQSVQFPLVLYGCKTWSLTVREEHKLRAFENKVLRRIFVPKRDGVTGGWRKLHNEELHNLYSSPSIIRIIKSRRMKWAGHVARMGKNRNVYGLLVGKAEGRDH